MAAPGRLALPAASCHAQHWQLDPDTVFLNHGSFGACPTTVLQQQSRLREELERDPVAFFTRRHEPLLDRSRAALAAFVGAMPERLALIPNATTGVNTVLRSIPFEAGDELIVTNHEYNACRNALDRIAQDRQARVVVVSLPFPIAEESEIVQRILAAVSRRTRLVMIDHITSPTGFILPVEQIAASLAERAVELLVDGAHAPGMVPLSLERLGASYYTGNCHKWLCTPKGSAFLYVDPRARAAIRPLVTSHGANSPRTDRSRYQIEFDWTGTHDMTPHYCIPAAIDFMATLLPGGWPALQEHNHRLAVEGRACLCQALGLDAPCPDDMIGSLGAVILGRDLPAADGSYAPYQDPLEKILYERHRITVPVIPWPDPPLRLVRISGQIYNSPEQYGYLARALLSSWDR
jgi:isopenicillin-N epimerase